MKQTIKDNLHALLIVALIIVASSNIPDLIGEYIYQTLIK